jgi:hypothetical protein
LSFSFLFISVESLKKWKKSTSPPNYGGGLLNTLNYETVYSTPELSKTDQITPRRFSDCSKPVVTVEIQQLM